MAGWAGEGGGRFGERREYEAPTLPSTPRQHGMARHYKIQARNDSPPQTPAEKQNAMPTRHDSPPPKQAHNPGDSRKTPPVKMRMAARYPQRMKKARAQMTCARAFEVASGLLTRPGVPVSGFAAWLGQVLDHGQRPVHRLGQ